MTRENFVVVQMNLFGDEEVTDLDGEVMTEKAMAVRRWGVAFTPTVIFLPEDRRPSGASASPRPQSQVMPGAFEQVARCWTCSDGSAAKGYEGDEHFQKFHARNIARLREEGRL